MIIRYIQSGALGLEVVKRWPEVVKVVGPTAEADPAGLIDVNDIYFPVGCLTSGMRPIVPQPDAQRAGIGNAIIPAALISRSGTTALCGRTVYIACCHQWLALQQVESVV